MIEFFAAVTRPIHGPDSLLSRADAIQETESLLEQFPIVYPDDQVIRTAIRGMATYGLSWFDAHLWAYADSRASPRFSARTFSMDVSTAQSASSTRLLIDCGRRELFWAGTHPRLR